MIFQLILSFSQGIILLILAPLFEGWLNWWKAYLTGRKRPAMWIVQPYRNLLKLFQLPSTRTKATSWVFQIAPYMVFTVYGILLFSIPLWTTSLLPPDLLLIIYLLSMGRFTLSIAGLDTGSSFGHLGSSREIFFNFLAEISLFSVIIAYWVWRSVEPSRSGIIYWLATLAILFAYLPVVLIEAHRLPIDNPETHLELTMSGKAVELEFSGRDLALVVWGEASKLFFLIGLWTRLFIQMIGIHSLSRFSIFLVYSSMWLIGFWGLAVWECRSVKMPLGRVPTIPLYSIILSLSAVFLMLVL